MHKPRRLPSAGPGFCGRRERRRVGLGMRAILVGSALAWFQQSVAAQTPPVVDYGAVEAVSTEGYTAITSVRELSDGRVLLADRLERLIYVLRNDLAREGVVGGHGQGPGEYLQVSRVLPLEGDSSTVVTDRGYLIVTPELEVQGVLPRERSFSAVDTRGYLYGLSRETFARLAAARRVTVSELDSITIERWHRDDPEAGRRVAEVPMLRPPNAISQRVAFEPLPLYLISPDGTLAIVHPEPYRVELVRPDGTRVGGPHVPYQPVRVTEAHKEEWREERRQPRSVLQARLGGAPGEGRIVTTTPPVTEPLQWAEFLPPFLGGALSFDREGRLWVRRTTDAGAPPILDVFDPEGKRIQQARLPAGTRLVGFGEGSAYVVRRDELGLEYLLRIRLR